VVMFEEKQLDDVFTSISLFIEKPIEGFLIGGLAMIKNNMKTATKDIDIVFENDEDARTFIEAAQEVGFELDTELPPEYEEMDAMVVLKDGATRRIDVFVRVVLKGLAYSESMRSRASSICFGDTLTIRISSNEDIFLFKSITSRDRDLADMEALARTGDIDWETIEEEARSQPTPWKWIGRLFGRLIELEVKTGIVMPLTSRLRKEAEIGQAIEILLEILKANPIGRVEAMRILEEDEGAFIDEVFSAMERYGLVTEKDRKFHLT